MPEPIQEEQPEIDQEILIEHKELLLPFPAQYQQPPTLFPTALYPPQQNYQMWEDPKYAIYATNKVPQPPSQPAPNMPVQGSVYQTPSFRPSVLLGFRRPGFTSESSSPLMNSRKNLVPPAGFKPFNLMQTREGLFTATYAGVHVWEIVVNGHGVMRRQHDDWINATHIMKAAGVEKSRRNKLLDKELVDKETERVQGGFGRFQGTWVGLETARQLAQTFGIYNELEPLLRTQPVVTEENR